MTHPQHMETDVQPGEFGIDPVLAADLNRLIGPDTMSVGEQVSTLNDMWASLGRVMPEPSEEQWGQMGWREDEGWRAQRRVLIFPFEESYAQSHAGLDDLTKRTKELAPQGFTPKEVSPLVTPTHVREAGGWKHEVSHVEDGPRSGVRALYKTPEGVVSRSDFLTRMAQEGRVLVGEDGKTWMYAMMDLSPVAVGAEAGTLVGDLHEEVDYTLVPEALVAMQLAHKLAGAEGQPITADVANEIIVSGSDADHENRFVTTVGLGSDTGRIIVSYDHSEASSPHGGYGIRAGGGYQAPFEQAA